MHQNNEFTFALFDIRQLNATDVYREGGGCALPEDAARLVDEWDEEVQAAVSKFVEPAEALDDHYGRLRHDTNGLGGYHQHRSSQEQEK